MTDFHPRYEAADERARWSGSLDELWKVLVPAAYRAQGRWVYRILPRGACVALRIGDDMRKVLRISRDAVPENPKAWATELDTFLKHFPVRMGAWKCERNGVVMLDEDDNRGTEAVFTEVLDAPVSRAPTREQLSLLEGP